MGRPVKAAIFLLLACFMIKTPVFSADMAIPSYFFTDKLLPSVNYNEERAWDERVSRSLGENLRQGVIASWYILFKNTLVMYYNGVLTGAPWAFPSQNSLYNNLRGNWKWEQTDGFLVNNIGHPIQGSIYFSAGRVTGFCFYQSIFFSTLGSLTWEVFHEGLIASTNDLLTTAPAGLSLGEILFRLYLQAYVAGIPAPIRMLMNPVAEVHRLITGWQPPNQGGNFYDFRTFFSIGYQDINYTISPSPSPNEPMFSNNGMFTTVGFNVVYGDPFAPARIPFRHFEFHASFGSDFHSHLDFRMFSDGYLFSFVPLYNERQAFSTGLSLHMDFAAIGEFDLFHSTLHMYSNSLGWTAKYRRRFPHDITWFGRAHAGFTFFGSSMYYNHEWGRELLNFGYGISLKYYSTLNLGPRNRIDLNASSFFQWNYPGTSALTRSFTRWHFFDVSFARLVSQQLSVGASFSLARERGVFCGFPDTRMDHWSAGAFVAWNVRHLD